MTDLTRLYDFTSGTTIASDQVDAEFDQLIARINAVPVVNTATGSSGLAAGVFAASRASSQNIASGATTKIQFSTEEIDVSGWYDNVTNYRYTPLLAGYYRLNLQVAATDIVGTDQQAPVVIIYKNGTAYRSRVVISRTTASQASLTCIAAANGSTDYFEAYVQNLTASAFNVGGLSRQTYFEGEFIGRS